MKTKASTFFFVSKRVENRDDWSKFCCSVSECDQQTSSWMYSRRREGCRPTKQRCDNEGQGRPNISCFLLNIDWQTLQIFPKKKMGKREMVSQFMTVNFTEEWIKENKKEFERVVDESIKYKRSLQGTLAQYEAMKEYDMKASQIKVPTLIIHGKSDLLVPFPNAHLVSNNIAHHTLIALEDVGHMFWIHQPQKISHHVSNFLTSNSKL